MIYRNAYLQKSASVLPGSGFREYIELRNQIRESVNDDELFKSLASFQFQHKKFILLFILQKDSIKRTDNEVKVLMKEIGERNKFFQEIRNELTDEAYFELFRAMKCENYSKGDVVIKHGEFGNKFFILVEGSTYVLIPKDKEVDESEFSDHSSFIPEAEREMTKVMGEQFPDFRVIKIFQEMAHFGDVSIKFNSRRTATIVCREDCTFGVIKANVYKAILKEYNKQMTKDLQVRIEKIPFFKCWPLSQLSILISLGQHKSFTKGNKIYEMGDPSSHVYILLEGEVMLQQERPKTGNLKSREKRRVIILSENRIFGDEEMTVRNGKRIYSAVCVSKSCKILAISKDDFLDNLKLSGNFRKLNEELSMKQSLRNKLIEKSNNVQRQYSAEYIPEFQNVDINPKSRSREKIGKYLLLSKIIGEKSKNFNYFKKINEEEEKHHSEIKLHPKSSMVALNMEWRKLCMDTPLFKDKRESNKKLMAKPHIKMSEVLMERKKRKDSNVSTSRKSDSNFRVKPKSTKTFCENPIFHFIQNKGSASLNSSIQNIPRTARGLSSERNFSSREFIRAFSSKRRRQSNS